VIRPAPRHITSWSVAEANAADWMRAWGYTDAALTPAGADSGIDVRASWGLAQVKFEASLTGRPALQRLVGARGHGTQQLLFFTGAGYSEHAVEYADEMGIALFTYDLAGAVFPVNGRARGTVASANAVPVGVFAPGAPGYASAPGVPPALHVAPLQAPVATRPWTTSVLGSGLPLSWGGLVRAGFGVLAIPMSISLFFAWVGGVPDSTGKPPTLGAAFGPLLLLIALVPEFRTLARWRRERQLRQYAPPNIDGPARRPE